MEELKTGCLREEVGERAGKGENGRDWNGERVGKESGRVWIEMDLTPGEEGTDRSKGETPMEGMWEVDGV